MGCDTDILSNPGYLFSSSFRVSIIISGVPHRNPPAATDCSIVGRPAVGARDGLDIAAIFSSDKLLTSRNGANILRFSSKYFEA